MVWARVPPCAGQIYRSYLNLEWSTSTTTASTAEVCPGVPASIQHTHQHSMTDDWITTNNNVLKFYITNIVFPQMMCGQSSQCVDTDLEWSSVEWVECNPADWTVANFLGLSRQKPLICLQSSKSPVLIMIMSFHIQYTVEALLFFCLY